MTQQGKAGIFLLAAVALGLVAYIVFSTKNETINFEKGKVSLKTVNDDKVNNLEKISLAEIESNYRSDLKIAIDGFEAKILAFDSGSSTESRAATGTDEAILEKIISDIAAFKIEIMDMTVPDELRDPHFALVKSLADIKDEIALKKVFNKDDLLKEVSEAKSRYDWLRN